jgi:hypothetical protein
MKFVYVIHSSVEGQQGMQQTYVVAEDIRQALTKYVTSLPLGIDYELHSVSRNNKIDIE